MIELLKQGIFEYNGVLVANINLLDEKDFVKVFDSNIVYVYDDNREYANYLINKVIRDIIIDDRFIDVQYSFFRDTRDRKGCTRNQLETLRKILGSNYEYELTNLQLVFLSKQRRGLIQKIIDTFKDTEFIYWMPDHATIKNQKIYTLD